MKKRTLLCLALLLSFFVNGQVQSPDDFLGYELGSAFTYHHKMVDYFKYVSEKSNKVQLFEYGTTYERRPLIAAVVSSEENLANIEQIRKNNLISAGLIEGKIEGKHLPIVWLSYNIHGNEAVSMEAAMKVLHTLANEAVEGVNDWLKETVVVLDPCENPDGRDRYGNWYNRTQSVMLNPNPDSWEHREPWPGGRYNHYLFDLNRDWAWQTQKESRQRIRIYQHWMPHVHVDLHEMGPNTPYFYAPSAKPFHEVITKWQREFHDQTGENHSKYFDKEGWLFFTKEKYDLFYPSYGDTWPTYNGAIGFTYEQGGSGRAGVGVIIENQDTLTLNDRIAHHYTSSLSTIEVSWKNKDKMLSEFKTYFSEGLSNPYGEYKSFVLKGDNNTDRLKAVLHLLDRQNIKYGYANGGRATRGFSYLENKEVSFALSSEDIVVSAYQPHSRFVKVLFEPKSNYEDSLTYDLTAWAVPYIYELEAYAVKERVAIANKEVRMSFNANAEDAEATYAYYAEWKDFQAAKFLAEITQKGVKVRFATEPFTAEGKSFGRGTLVITKADNRKKADFHKIVIDAANHLEQTLVKASTGMVTTGKDLGSSTVKFIEQPKIALVNGDGTYATSFGELWHYFEQQLEYPVTVLNTRNFNSADLSKYNTIILGAGNYGMISSNLKDFIREGGKVIALEQAIRTFDSDSKTSLGEANDIYKDALSRKYKKEGDELLSKYGDAERESLTKSVEGSIYKVYLDETHPLAFGDDNTLHLIKRNSTSYPYLKSGWNVGTFQEDSHVSGFVGHQLKEELKNTLAVGVERFGRGKIIYMTDSPIFRGFWHSGKLFFANALFLVN